MRTKFLLTDLKPICEICINFGSGSSLLRVLWRIKSLFSCYIICSRLLCFFELVYRIFAIPIMWVSGYWAKNGTKCFLDFFGTGNPWILKSSKCSLKVKFKFSTIPFDCGWFREQKSKFTFELPGFVWQLCFCIHNHFLQDFVHEIRDEKRTGSGYSKFLCIKCGTWNMLERTWKTFRPFLYKTF